MSPRARRRWLPVLFALLAMTGLAYGACALWWPSRKPTPAISLPENLDALEPDVRRLVEQQIAELRAAPLNAARHVELALVYEANELWAEARRAYEAAVELDGSNSLWRLHRAITTQETGDFESACELFENLVRDVPSLAPAQQRLGQALLEKGDLVGAEAAYQQVVRLAPEAAEGYAGLADVRLRQGQVDSAIELLQRAVELDKTYRVAHFLLGSAYRRQQRLDDAVRELQLGQNGKVRYLPDSLTRRAERYAATVRARHTLALKRMVAGDFKSATELLEAAVRAAPNNLAIINALAGAYMQTGRVDDAYQWLLKANELDDRNATTHINLASWYLYSGRLDECSNTPNEPSISAIGSCLRTEFGSRR